VSAALDLNAHEATGLAGALQLIKHQSYGPTLLGVTAVGFLAFGVYGIAESIFRRINRSSVLLEQSWFRA
jgi:hypothetical protein